MMHHGIHLFLIQLTTSRPVELVNIKRASNFFRNSILDPAWKSIERSVRLIAGSTIDSLIRTLGIGDIYRIYIGTKRDGLDFHMAYIPGDFDVEPEEAFDKEYMNKLFELGYNKAKRGYPWKSVPPGINE